ncbi:hypothetical protein ADN00_04970 [Ornatilinea apprima]|uniref:Uncharacterized protein n=1 Tax=Ornatilinea apprima TaxID=1134406 RepID=A0A0P6YB98_9CHLR|nr:hypothetical protein ADN00_04970 [Ornatilinea apprima]
MTFQVLEFSFLWNFLNPSYDYRIQRMQAPAIGQAASSRGTSWADSNLASRPVRNSAKLSRMDIN